MARPRHMRPHRRGYLKIALASVSLIAAFMVVTFVGHNFASAGSSNFDEDTFGLSNASVSFVYEEPTFSSDSSSETLTSSAVVRQAQVDGDDVELDSISFDEAADDAEATLAGVPVRDVSEGIAQIEAEEEAARIKAEKEAAAKEQADIARAAENRAVYLAQFGSLPLEDVDFSIGKDAFIAEWTERINNFLGNTPLGGYGEVFATVAWEQGIDPRWSAAISRTESSSGQVCFLPYNAWGWGASVWGDWVQAITDHVTGLATGYGYTISETFAHRYCPPDPEWYSKTLSFMNEI